MVKDLFGNISSSRKMEEPHEKRILKELAWRIFPVNTYTGVSEMANALGMAKTQLKRYLNSMTAAGKVIAIGGEGVNGRYGLPFPMYLSLLSEIKKEPGNYLYRTDSNTYDWYAQAWVKVLHAYVQKGIDDIQMPSAYPDPYLVFIFMYMPLYEEWKPFFNRLHGDLIYAAFHAWAQKWELGLEKPDEKCLKEGFLENEAFPSDVRRVFQEEYMFYQYVLSGRLDVFQPDVSVNPLYLCSYALRLQYDGRIAEAIKVYQQVARMNVVSLLGNVLFDTCYGLALAADNSPSSRKKLDALSRKKELKNNPCLLPLRLVVFHALGLDTTLLSEGVVRAGKSLPPLPRVLSLLLIRHFHLNDNIKIDDEAVREIIDREDLTLLQLECSQDFMPFMERADDLRDRTGLTPLLLPYVKQEKWEKVVTALLEKVQSDNDMDASAASNGGTRSRIIYLVSQTGEITPKLQKSKDGMTWSKGRNIALSTFQAGIPEMNDRDKAVAAHVKHYVGGWGYGDMWGLRGPNPLAELAGYPLVFAERQPDVPVVITKEEPELTVTKTSDGFRIENNVSSAKISSDVILHVENDFLFHVLTLTPEQRELLNILSELQEFPKESEKQLMQLLPLLSRKMTVHSDLIQNGKQLETVKADTTITVLLQPVGRGIRAELFVKPFVEQPPYCKAGKGNISVMGTEGEKRVQAMRDFKEEKRHLQEVMDWLQPVCEELEADEDVFFFDDAYQSLDMLEILHEHLNSIRIEWPQGGRMYIKGMADFGNLSISVKGSGQWFELEGELKLDEHTLLGMSELLQKVRSSKGRFIALSDGEFVALSDKLRKQLQVLEGFLTQEKGKLKLPSLTAGSLLEIEQEGGELKKGRAFSQLLKRMEMAEKQRIELPGQLKAELRGYQIDGFRWMSRLAGWGAGACLADDMGLGKTLQAIALMLSRGKLGPSLVVVPASVVINWKNELERFAPSLTPLVMNEVGCNRKALITHAAEYDVVLATYGLLINEADELAGKAWNVIALDEAHVIKNKETKMSQAAMRLNGSFRLLLTGTPLQNHLGEIWNLFQFANPGLLGSFQQFTEKFIVPIEKNNDKNRQRQLKRLLQPFILRRSKNEVLDELPEKTEITLHVELTEQERALYETLRREAVANLEEGTSTAIQTLAEITRLRQAACHPALVYPEMNLLSAKSAAFLKLVDELNRNNHRSLVFSQFTSHLNLIRKELDRTGIDYLYLDGSTSITERNRLVKMFQTGEQPLFLISLKAGGLGLNLTAADYVIHLDPWWNPAVEDQASDRAYRIGQTRPVTVYRLIATHTIEEKIICLHQTKKSLADSLLDGSDIAHKLTKEEMMELLREGDLTHGSFV